MQIFLVGGAVRDTLLGLTVSEKDWVVVGASVEEMLAEGYIPVGKDFPVFIHPDTGDEYALARTERKTGRGYKGFHFHASPEISLEEDLNRRDITLNAMAMHPQSGELIDPYGGQEDLENRIIRHVSDAFHEDPVRVLRVARFMARYAHLGFHIAEETMALMRSMVKSGELDYLVPERVWKEMQRALGESNPAQFFTTLRECGALAVIMPELDCLFGVPQPAEHHPEIDTGLHSLLVLQAASKASNNTKVRFGALVHDLGKGQTPKAEWPRHIAHEARSPDIIRKLSKRLAIPNAYRDLALSVATYHTHCHRALELKGKTLVKMLNDIGAFRDEEKLEQFLTCCEADARGRTGLEDCAYPQSAYVKKAFAACQQIDIAELMAQGYHDEALGRKIHDLRCRAVEALRRQHNKGTS